MLGRQRCGSPSLSCLQVDAEGGGGGVGARVDVRDLERDVAGFMPGRFARAEGSVGRHHVRPTVDGQIEYNYMVVRGSSMWISR